MRFHLRTSLDPKLTSVFMKSAPFLKECVPFLKEKAKIADDLKTLEKENADFLEATRMVCALISLPI